MVVQVINDQIAVAVALLDNPMWEDKMLGFDNLENLETQSFTSRKLIRGSRVHLLNFVGKQTEEDCVLIRPARAVDCRSPPELISSLAPPEATIAPVDTKGSRGQPSNSLAEDTQM
ncbi:hypothetical protein V1478_000786, partial [Vespula squamosa]